MSILISVVLFDSNFHLSSDKNVLGNSGNIDLDNEELIRAVMDLFADKSYANMWTSSTNQLDDSNVPSGEQISGDAPMPSLDNPPSTIEPPAPDVGPEVAPEVGPEVAPEAPRVGDVTAEQNQPDQGNLARPRMEPMVELTSQEIRDLKPKSKKKKRNSGLVIDSETCDESLKPLLESKDKTLFTKEDKLGWDTENNPYFYGL